MKAKDMPLYDIQEILTTKERVDEYEKAVNEMIESGELEVDDEYITQAKNNVFRARERQESDRKIVDEAESQVK